MSAVTAAEGGGGDATTPTTATTPSMMSGATGSTAETSPPASPGKTPTDARRPRSPGLIDAADVHKLNTDLNEAVAARAAAETRVDVLEAELARFKDQYMFTNAAKEAVEAQLREEITRREKAEEKVEMLRGQVEQSREIVMRLQKQDQDRAARRQSAHAESPDEPPTAPAKKRMSLYGSRRPTSGPGAAGGGDDAPPSTTESKPPGGLRELRLGGGASSHSRNRSGGNLRAPPLPSTSDLPPSPSTPRKMSLSPRSPRISPARSASGSRRDSDEDRDTSLKSPGLRSSRPHSPSPPLLSPPPTGTMQIPGSMSRRASSTSQTLSAPGTSPAATAMHEHIEALKSSRLETEALRAQVAALEMKLNEAEDARAASDTLVRSLREFMAADPTAGAGSVNLPPLPSEIDDDNDDPFSPSSKTIDLATPTSEKRPWGFGGLWRNESSSAQAPPPLPEKERTPSLLSRRDSASSTSASIAFNSPPLGGNEVLHSVMEAPEVPDKPKEQGGWLAGWRSVSTTQVAQQPKAAAPAPDAPKSAQASPAVASPAATPGANLGRSLTSFFGRSGRRASAAKAAHEQVQKDRDSTSIHEDDGDAPLAAAVAAAAAAETSEPGLQFDRLNNAPAQSPATTTASLPLADSPATRTAPLPVTEEETTPVPTTIQVVHSPPPPIVTEPEPQADAAPVSPRPAGTPVSATSTSSTSERIAAARAKAQAMAAQRDEEKRKRSQDSARSPRTPDTPAQATVPVAVLAAEPAEATSPPKTAASPKPTASQSTSPPKPTSPLKPKTPLTVETKLPVVDAPEEDSGLAYLSGGGAGAVAADAEAVARSSEERAARRRGVAGASPRSGNSSAFGLDLASPRLDSPRLSPGGLSPRLSPRLRTRSPSPAPSSPIVRAGASEPGSPAMLAGAEDEREMLADADADAAGTPETRSEAGDAEGTDAAATPPKRPERRARAPPGGSPGGFL